MILEVSENWMDNKESYTLIKKKKKVWLSSLLSPVSEYTDEQMGARGEEKKQLTSYPNSERVYISYGWASRFGQTPEFPIHKENFQFDIRLNHTRMKGSLFLPASSPNYPAIGHALELIDFPLSKTFSNY